MKLIESTVEMYCVLLLSIVVFLTENVEIYAVRTKDYSSDVSPVWFTSWEMARDAAAGRKIMVSKVMRVCVLGSRPDYDSYHDGYSFRLFRHNNKHAVRTAKFA